MTEILEVLGYGPVRAFAVANAAALQTAVTGPARLYGWSLRETSGAAVATVRILTSGASAGEIALAAGASSTAWFGPTGVDIMGDLAVSTVAGVFAGCVYVAYPHSH